MKTKEFIRVLEKNLSKELLFEYENNKYVGTNYHLTEVKNVSFDTVDCGGKSNSWKETQLQLWESPKEIGKTTYMTVDKIHSIIKKVNEIKPLNVDTTIRIEYGNDNFHTSVMDIDKIESRSDKIIVKLFAEATLCKANDECGIPQKKEAIEEACCAEVGCC